jgi:DNA modification methylase
MKELLDGRIRLYSGDCREVLADLPENSVDAVVTDPPYELGFMGKSWDRSGVAFQPETWASVGRVLKPGGWLAAFGAPRNNHRLVCAIEDAGFEIRDQIGWVYGSGFPKSHDVSKGIDAAAGVERGKVPRIRSDGKPTGKAGGSFNACDMSERSGLPVTDAARQWEGWGTALKPAWEPIVLARKPLSEGTVAANVLRWGTGAINVDGCRVRTTDTFSGSGNRPLAYAGDNHRPYHDREPRGPTQQNNLGRWPANLIHDGSEEVVSAFPETGVAVQRNGGGQRIGSQGIYHGSAGLTRPDIGFGGSGSAARFFYCAKASKAERLGSKHPTVKPIDLKRYLVRLLTPPGGVALDPFAGTGTTGEAAWREGFQAILIEREAEYVADIERRLALCRAGRSERRRAARSKDKPAAAPLFGDAL